MKKNFFKKFLTVLAVFLLSVTVASATVLFVPQGGTGASTLTGILKGNGTGAVTAVALPGTTTTFLNGAGAFTAPTGFGDLFGPASSTDNAITRFDSTTGKLVQNSTVTIDDNGKYSASIATGQGVSLSGSTTSNLLKLTPTGSLGTSTQTSGALNMDFTGASGIAFQMYTNGDSSGLTYPQILFHSENVLYNQPIVQITQKTQAGLGNSPNLRLDGGGSGPQIEWRQTTDPNYHVTGAGQFEQQVQGDIFFINGRNAADSSFENSIWFLRPSTSEGMNGNVGIGVNPYGIEKLTLGATTGGAPRLALGETTAPTATSGYGKIYAKSSDSLLYFMSDAGTEYNLTTGGTAISGADASIAASGATYTKPSTAVTASPSTGWTLFDEVGSITETTKITPAFSSIRLNLSGGSTITNNGATLATLFSPSTTGLGRTILDGGKLLQSNATAQGVALDLSDMPNTWVSHMRIEEYGTAIQMIDAASTSFYSSVRDMQLFNNNNCVSLGGTQPNLNLWENIRCRQKAGGGGTGFNLVDTRGNVFIMTDAEPATAAGLTGYHVDATSRDNLFLGIWAENNAQGVLIDAGANNNVFIGGSITSNTTDLTDNGTNTTMIGVNKTGTKIYRLPKLTDIQGLNLLTFTETASAVNNLNFANASTGNSPVLSAVGSNTDIGITLTPKGAGDIKLSANTNPATSDGAALGTTALEWSDLFLASGSVINFNNGDVTLTHSTDTLTLAGGTFSPNDIALSTGSAIRTRTSAGNTALFQARDVDGAAYTTFATLTANNTPTFDIAPTSITTTNITSGGIIAGVWTPTLTNVANLDASTAFECQYQRNGATVSGSCRVSIDPTLAATSTQLGISLPVASNFGAIEDAAGSCFATGIAGQGAGIIADTTNDRLQMQYVSGDVTNQPMTCSFSYQVI